MPRAILASFFALVSIAADWPGWRGPTGDGRAVDAEYPLKWGATENVKWRVPLAGTGHSSPAVVGGKVFITGCVEAKKERVLYCLDRTNGSILWEKAVLASPLEGKHALNSFASSTPACDGERVYVTFFDRPKARVYCYSVAGEKLWDTSPGEFHSKHGFCSSPVLHGDLVIVNASVESESLVALDKTTGKEVWRAPGMKESWNTPVLVKNPAGKTELVVAVFGKVLGFDPDKGTPLWSCETKIPWYMVPSVVAEKGIVFCIGGRGGGGSLAIKTGGNGAVEPLWRGKKGSNVSSPVYHNGHLYWASDSMPIVSCTNAETGELVYEERLPRAEQFYPSVVLGDGKLYYLSRSGQVFVVAAKPAFELLGTNKLEERAMFNASPVIADGRLFIRSDRWLYAIGK